MIDDKTIKESLEDSIQAKKGFLADDDSISRISGAAEALIGCYKSGGKAIIFGNGGSAADSQHMAAELIVRFEKDRKSLPAIALNTNTSSLTAAGNDYGFNSIFSRQIDALAGPPDVAVAISTSGTSGNVIEGARAAKKKGVPVIALTGRTGGELAELADIPIVVKNNNTARIQEVHICIIHTLCKLIEDAVG